MHHLAQEAKRNTEKMRQIYNKKIPELYKQKMAIFADKIPEGGVGIFKTIPPMEKMLMEGAKQLKPLFSKENIKYGKLFESYLCWRNINWQINPRGRMKNTISDEDYQNWRSSQLTIVLH
jgi:hypothetical protein